MSPLASRYRDRLSVWIIWTHYAVAIMLKDGLISTKSVSEEAFWMWHQKYDVSHV